MWASFDGLKHKGDTMMRKRTSQMFHYYVSSFLSELVQVATQMANSNDSILLFYGLYVGFESTTAVV